MSEKWVQTWGQSHAALSVFYYPACKKTYRLVMSSAIAGRSVRICFSNKCGKAAVSVGAVTACLCNEQGDFIGEPVEITVNGSRSFTLAVGAKAMSNEAELNVEASGFFCVSAYVESGALRSGNLLSNVNLITAKGNRADDRVLPNEPRVRDTVRKLACKVLRMFFHKPIPLFESVELFSSTADGSIAVFGDSICQQGFWTNAIDCRIREIYQGRYSLINKSIMGNRVLRDCSTKMIFKNLFGQRGTQRIKDDILPYDDIKYVVFALGINDFIQYGSIVAWKSEKPDTDKMCDAIRNITLELQAQGKKVIMLTILPFGDYADYSHEKGELHSIVNTWLRANKQLFDGFYDQAAICSVPGKETCMKLEYVGPDKLHLNDYGGKFVADSMDISVFG